MAKKFLDEEGLKAYHNGVVNALKDQENSIKSAIGEEVKTNKLNVSGNVTSSLIPESHQAKNLGSKTNWWKNIFSKEVAANKYRLDTGKTDPDTGEPIFNTFAVYKDEQLKIQNNGSSVAQFGDGYFSISDGYHKIFEKQLSNDDVRLNYGDGSQAINLARDSGQIEFYDTYGVKLMELNTSGTMSLWDASGYKIIDMESARGGFNIGWDNFDLVHENQINLIPDFNWDDEKGVKTLDVQSYDRIKIGGYEYVNTEDCPEVIFAYKPANSEGDVVPFAITRDGVAYYDGSEVANAEDLSAVRDFVVEEITDMEEWVSPRDHKHDEYLQKTGGTVEGDLTCSGMFNNTLMRGGVIDVHPDVNTTQIAYYMNELAYLTDRGGSYTVEGCATSSNAVRMFDGTTSYAHFTVANTTDTVVINIKTGKNYTYECRFGIGFGADYWRAKSIKFELGYATEIGGDPADDAWVTLSDAESLSNSIFICNGKGPTTGNSSTRPWNNIRITLTNFHQKEFRIAGIWSVANSNGGLESTLMPRNGGAIYGGIYPATNAKYSLGTSAQRWNSVYATTYYEGDTSLESKYIKRSDAIKSLSIDGHTLTTTKGDNSTSSLRLPTNADTVDGYHVTTNGYDGIPIAKSDGFMEVGKAIDFHYTNSSDDYSARFILEGDFKNTITIPNTSGKLCVHYELQSASVASSTEVPKYYKICDIAFAEGYGYQRCSMKISVSPLESVNEDSVAEYALHMRTMSTYDNPQAYIHTLNCSSMDSLEGALILTKNGGTLSLYFVHKLDKAWRTYKFYIHDVLYNPSTASITYNNNNAAWLDTYSDTLFCTSKAISEHKASKLYAPASSGSSTYGVGSNGQVLMSNGSTVYWGDAPTGSGSSVDLTSIKNDINTLKNSYSSMSDDLGNLADWYIDDIRISDGKLIYTKGDTSETELTLPTQTESKHYQHTITLTGSGYCAAFTVMSKSATEFTAARIYSTYPEKAFACSGGGNGKIIYKLAFTSATTVRLVYSDTSGNSATANVTVGTVADTVVEVK